MSNKLVQKWVRTSGLLAASLALLAVNACGVAKDPVAPPATTPLPPKARIISLLPSLTETVCDLGLTSQLVARTTNDDYPPEILGLPDIGDVQPNFEAMLGLRPDAVLLDAAYSSATMRQRLQQLGVRVIATRIETLSDLSQQLPQLGAELGCQSAALALQQRLQQESAALQTGAATLSRHPRVFIELYHQPLMTSGGQGLTQELLLLAGGTNVFADLDSAYPQIDSESLMLRQPDIVVLLSLTLDQARRHPQLGQLPAIKAGRVLEINPSLVERPTLRSLRGAQQMQDYFRRWSQESAAQGANTQGANTQGINAHSATTHSATTHSVNAQSTYAQSTNAQSTYAQSTYAQSTYAQSTNAQSTNAQGATEPSATSPGTTARGRAA